VGADGGGLVFPFCLGELALGFFNRIQDKHDHCRAVVSCEAFAELPDQLAKVFDRFHSKRIGHYQSPPS
jgi:hypothetical protein